MKKVSKKLYLMVVVMTLTSGVTFADSTTVEERDLEIGETFSAASGVFTMGSDSIKLHMYQKITTDDSGIKWRTLKYTLTAAEATVESDDMGLVTGGDAYTELRTGANGTYISDTNTTATNLKNLDERLSTLSNTKIAVADDTDSISIDTATNATTGETTYTISVDTSTVADNDTGLLTSHDAYTELRPTDGTYVKQANTTATNLKALDDKALVTGATITATTANDGNVIKSNDGTKMATFSLSMADTLSTTDTGFVSGSVLYSEVRPADGTYVKQSNTTADNLTVLDTQVKTNADNIADLQNRVGNKLDSIIGEVNQIGAGAAALAALRPEPYDPDDRWSFAAGYGHYKNGNAAALGVFFKPDAHTTFSFSSTVWSGDPMLNFGASFKLGSGTSYEKTYPSDTFVKRELTSLRKSNDTLSAENQKLKEGTAAQAKEIERLTKKMKALEADHAAQAKEVVTLRADNEKMKKQIAQILAKMEMSDKVKRAAK